MEQNTGKDQFNWQLPCYAGVFAATASLPFLFLGSFDILQIFYVFAVAPLVSLVFALVVLIIAVRSNETPRLSVFLMLPVFWIVTWVLFRNSFEVRSAGRWAFAANQYKAKVLAQPNSRNGDLRHIEWDGWGFAGEDNVAYLVFDPNDALLKAARSKSPGSFPGIPCGVYRIRRLESHWYTALFYTDTDWDHCS